MVLDEQLMPLEEAIRKMTSLPAGQFGLSKRGELKRDYAADIVVFHPDELEDHATYGNPHMLSSGIRDVLINGVRTLKSNSPTNALPGCFV